MAEFTDDQVGKRVVAQDGSEVGTVTDVRDGDLYVEEAAGADPDVIDALGWGGRVNREVHHLRQEYVSHLSDDVVRLNV